MKFLILVLSISVNSCLCLQHVWRSWILWVYHLVVVVGDAMRVVFYVGFDQACVVVGVLG